MGLLLLLTVLFVNVCLSSPPISPREYNLIDVTPRCYTDGVCPFEWGTKTGYFPNSEERFQHVLRNLFRQFVNHSTNTSLGKWTTGVGGSRVEYNYDNYPCGSTYYPRKPMLWYSDSNQLARWKQWNYNECNGTVRDIFYGTNGHSAHEACPDIYNSESDYECSWFINASDTYHSCSLEARVAKYGVEDDAKIQAEGLWGSNAGYSTSHCMPIFLSATDYIGMGYIEGMNDVCQVFSKWMDEITYQIPIGAHYDERNKIAKADRSTEDKYFNLICEYWDTSRSSYQDPTEYATAAYALYNGTYHEMELYIKETLTTEVYSGMYRAAFEMPMNCSAYAFVIKTSEGNYYRLPENTDYYFGTAWVPWDYWGDPPDYPYPCDENHYYYNSDNNRWIVNGGPNLTDTNDIQFYDDHDTCAGCEGLPLLDCAYLCILSKFDPIICADCNSTLAPTTTNYPTSTPITPSPNNNPTQSSLSPTTLTPTITDKLPNVSNLTCTKLMQYGHDFDEIKKWKRKWESKYVLRTIEMFAHNHSECILDEDIDKKYGLDFIYSVHYDEDRDELDVHLIVCCNGTFGDNYVSPEGYSQSASLKKNKSEVSGWETWGSSVFYVFLCVILCVICYYAGMFAKQKYEEKEKTRTGTETQMDDDVREQLTPRTAAGLHTHDLQEREDSHSKSGLGEGAVVNNTFGFPGKGGLMRPPSVHQAVPSCSQASYDPADVVAPVKPKRGLRPPPPPQQAVPSYSQPSYDEDDVDIDI